MTDRKSICLVDDHVVVRHGLAELIEKVGPYSVVHQYNHGGEFLDALPLKPQVDVVVLDINMPVVDGKEVMRRLKELRFKTPVLVLTLNEDENAIIHVFRMGARGYLRKNCSARELTTALSDILGRGYYHNEFLALSLHNDESRQKKSEQEKILDQLTQREREFLKLVCDEREYTYDQIADQMKVQHRTVDGYRESIFEKFGIKSKTGLVLFVLKYKLLDAL